MINGEKRQMSEARREHSRSEGIPILDTRNLKLVT